MSREAYDPDVVREILAAELGADAELAGLLEQLLLQFHVAERLAMLVALRGQLVVVPRGGELDRLQAGVGTGAADDDGDVIRRAGSRAEGPELADQEFQDAFRGQHRLRLLVEGRLVGRAPALGDEEELVGVAVHGLDVDLGRQVGAGVDLPVHVERHRLRVAQVLLGVGLVHPLRERLLVPASGPDLLALLGDDGRGARVLAYRQLEPGGDLGIAQQRHCHDPVVRRGFRVAQDPAHGLVVLRAKHEGNVAHRLVGEDGQRLGVDREDLLALEGPDGNVLLRALHFPVAGLVLAQGERILVDERFGCHLENSLRKAMLDGQFWRRTPARILMQSNNPSPAEQNCTITRRGV